MTSSNSLMSFVGTGIRRSTTSLKSMTYRRVLRIMRVTSSDTVFWCYKKRSYISRSGRHLQRTSEISSRSMTNLSCSRFAICC